MPRIAGPITNMVLIDGEIGPITAMTVTVYQETQGWTMGELRQEIVRLRLLLLEEKDA